MAIGLLAAAVCAFWWRLVLLRGYLELDDMGAYHMPMARLYAQALAAGRLPLWTPDLGAGYPVFAEGQIGALYPPNLFLFRLFSPLVAMNLSVLGHVLLATLAAYACARALRISRMGSLLSGAAFGLSGLMAMHGVHVNILRVAAWLPLLILCVERAATSQRPWRWAPAIAGVTWMQWLAGHPQTTALCLGAAVWYAIFAAREGVGFWRQAGRLWPVVAAGIVLGMGLGAAQSVATSALAAFSGRPALGGGQSAFGLMPAHYLVSLLLPTLFGSPKPNTFPGEIWQFQEWCGYIGAIPLALAASGLRWRGGWRMWALAMLAVIALVVAVSPQVAGVIGGLPLLRGTRVPARALLLFVISGSLLAGIGLDRARADGRGARILGWTAAGLIVLGALGWLSHGRWQWVVGFQPDRWRDLADYAREAELWVIGGTMAAAALALRLRQPAAVALLAGIELFAFGANYQAVVPRDFYERVPWTAKVALAQGKVRLYSRPYLREAAWRRLLRERGDWSADQRMLEADRDALNYNWPAWYGLQGLRVYSALPLAPYQEFARKLALEAPPDEASLWGATGTRAIITPRYFGPAPHATAIFWVADAPRARVVGAQRVSDDATALEGLLWWSDPRREAVIVAPQEVALPRSARGWARIVEEAPLRVTVEADAEGPAALALADAAAPGWHATVNGRESAIWPSDGMFRGVLVPGGRSRVVFEYRPAPVRVGFFVGLAAVAVWCGALAAWGMGLRREPSPAA